MVDIKMNAALRSLELNGTPLNDTPAFIFDFAKHTRIGNQITNIVSQQVAALTRISQLRGAQKPVELL